MHQLQKFMFLFAILAFLSCGEEEDRDVDTTPEDTGCKEEEIFPVNTPAKIMFLVDKSGSMAGKIWDLTGRAIETVLSTYTDNEFLFGYSTFPYGDSSCSVPDTALIDTKEDNNDIISDTHKALIAEGGTPLYCGLKKFTQSGYAQTFSAPGLDAYILVITDGADTCGSSCPNSGLGISTDLKTVAEELLALGIRTVGVGFGFDSPELKTLTENGGSVFTSPLRADSEEELIESFDAILAAAFSCRYKIDPEDIDGLPFQVRFYMDDVLLDHDENCNSGIGWAYTTDDYTEAILCDMPCKKLRNRRAQEIRATFGCQTPII